MHRIRLVSVLPAIVLAACSGPVATPGAGPVPELRPGIPAGYLSRDALPDSLALLPPPPASGSGALAADEEAYRSGRQFKGTARWDQAITDSNLRFPAAAGAFACALGASVSEKATPRLYLLLRRSMIDAGLATYAAKNHWARIRPFAVHKEASCTPGEEAALAKEGSYPSGHAAIGWTWALVLAELSPARTDLLLARGRDFAQSRSVCGVHWQSDIQAGQSIAAGVVARLHADATFQADLQAAGQELIRAAETQPVLEKDCSADTKAATSTARSARPAER